MADNRARARDLVIAPVKHPDRREECEASDALWLRTYCPDVFYNPFTLHQQRIIAACGESLLYGTEKCKAAPRGDGKSSIVKYLALKYSLRRQVKFPLILSATSAKSKKTLNSLKRRLASRSISALSEDYPLECHVARYVDPWPSRARNVTANGRRSVHVEWSSESFILPTWEDEEPLGPIVLGLGITSDELQGCNVYDQRPDFVILDDLDSRDSLAAEDGVVAGKIEELIDKSVAGLAGQSKRLGKFMLCTITSRDSAAFKYSDPKQKPSWSGERIAAITSWPERMDLWETYVELRQNGQSQFDADGNPRDVFGRDAHAFYLENREKMDAGAILTNPYNFEADVLPDGTQKQISALQRCYDYIADKGMASFLTEHQNDPPEEDGPIESGISGTKIQSRLSGFPARVVPPDCVKLTRGVDIRKAGAHFVVKAWRPDATFYVVHYGFVESHGTESGTDEGIELAMRRLVLQLDQEAKDEPYRKPDGSMIPLDLTLVDSGWQAPAIYQACAEIGVGIYPAKGHGKSHGCTSPNFNDIWTRTRDRKPGDGWFMSRLGANRWLVHCDTDRWKSFEHARWMTPEGKPGAGYLFGEISDEERRYLDKRLPRDAKEHMAFSRHITAEVEVEETVRGVLKRFWKIKAGRVQNHYLDASYLADVAASIVGVRLMGEAKSGRIPSAERPTVRDLMAKAGR